MNLKKDLESKSEYMAENNFVPVNFFFFKTKV